MPFWRRISWREIKKGDFGDHFYHLHHGQPCKKVLQHNLYFCGLLQSRHHYHHHFSSFQSSSFKDNYERAP